MPIRALYYWVRWARDRRRAAFFVLLLLMLLACGLLSLALAQMSRAAAERRVGYEALLGLERLLSTLTDAETGQRGYLLADDPEYLGPYRGAVDQFASDLTLVQRYKPFPDQLVAQLRRQVRDKFAEMAETIRLHDSGRRAEALALVRTGRGKRLMDATRVTIARLQAEERARVTRTEDAHQAWVDISVAGFATLLVVVAILVAALVRAYGREERARHEAELRIEYDAAFYEAITRAAPGAIITTDGDGIVREWNPAAERIFGWTESEVLGQSVLRIIPERYRERHAAGMARAVAARAVGHPGKAWELFCLRADGMEFPAELFLDVFEIDSIVNCIGIVRDITPRRHMEAQQTRLTAELKRSNDELAKFAYVASHDLQEPLRMVNRFVGLLEEKHGGEFDAEGRRYMAFAREGAQRMQRLINDLLAYSRVTTKARPFVPIDLARLVPDVIHDLSERTAHEGGRVQVAAELPVVLGEAFQLRQLFQNLIANGLKFHQPGTPPLVTVACTARDTIEDGQCWHFTVVDNGIGIAPEDACKLFQLFTRLHAREDYEGTGIGLAICQKIVERHGGRIWIESVPGQGATFHFTLPRQPKE